MVQFEEIKPNVFVAKIPDLDCVLALRQHQNGWIGSGLIKHSGAKINTEVFPTINEAKNELIANLLNGLIIQQQSLAAALLYKI